MIRRCVRREAISPDRRHARRDCFDATRLAITTDLPLREGDELTVAVPEQWLLTGALAVYALPLTGLVAGAIAGDVAAANAGAMLGGAAGFLCGWAVTFFAMRRRQAPAVITKHRRDGVPSQRVTLESHSD